MGVFRERRDLVPYRSSLLPSIFTDTLVIGSGVAGLRCAIEASKGGEVIVLAKESLDLSNTSWAQGGIAAAIDDGDSLESHLDDTLEAGAGLCEPSTVRTLVSEGPGEVRTVIDWGMRVDRDRAGSISLGLEGGHRRHRIVHADGDATGHELARVLHARARAEPRIRIFERCFAVDLIVSRAERPRVTGALTWHPRYGLQLLRASHTVLASGGAGQVYRESTNPRVATGDGLAMAWRAGAVLADLEFMQFHPTALYIAGSHRALISEAVRGEGAHLVDRAGTRFMLERHEMAELAPRDVVSRAIVEHLAATHEPNVFLDARPIGGERFRERFPGLARMLADFDLDPGRDLVPVHPAAHYTIGGVVTDEVARTSLPGLLAAGEAACCGIHGANRLASNSLLEGLVFGRRAASTILDAPATRPLPEPFECRVASSDRADLDPSDIRQSLRSAMWRHVGIVRNGARLKDVRDMFRFWARYGLQAVFDDPSGWETQNLLMIGTLMTQAALARTESRGTHAR
ncbi:MAG: L-aspartate oxidase, partial [Phycisphaerae bacterium]|nr:L-aspartate oxidase [Phycisphaerae bacterium]